MNLNVGIAVLSGMVLVGVAARAVLATRGGDECDCEECQW